MATRESDFWNERGGPRIAPEYLSGILSTAADIAIVVTAGGRVQSVAVNPLNAQMGRLDHWEGRDIRDVLAPDSQSKVARAIEAIAEGQRHRADGIEVNHVDGAAWEAPIRYSFHSTGHDGRILMLGRDLRPVAEMQQRLVRAQAALEKDFEAQRIHETRFRALLSQTSDAFVLVDLGSGRVIEANRAASELLTGTDEPLAGTAMASELEGRRRAELMDAIANAAAEVGTLDVRAARPGRALRLHPRAFRNGGDRVALCRVEAADGPAAPRDPLSDRLIAFFRAAADAVVFVDRDGLVEEANEAFLSLADLDTMQALRGRPLRDYLARGSVDMRVLTDPDGPRLYATRLVSAFGTQVPVEITPVPLGGGAAAFVLREADRVGPLRDGGPETALEPATANARSLVGTMPLRDIVSSMTDVIERECIEAAVELTDNNRVAAAEMLGLSRQSLYVKLRKYGLLQRDE